MSSSGLEGLFGLIGARHWKSRLAEIREFCAAGPRAGQASRQRYAIELVLAGLQRPTLSSPSSTHAELGRIAGEIPAAARALTSRGRERLVVRLRECLSGANTLVPVFHLFRTAMLQQSRGFEVAYAGPGHGGHV